MRARRPGSQPANRPWRFLLIARSMNENPRTFEVESETHFPQSALAHGMTQASLIVGVEHEKAAAACSVYFSAERAIRHRVIVPSITAQDIDAWYDYAMANGALGGKIIGAGGGGFLMFYANDKARLRHAMRESGLREVRFRFDFEGTRILI